MNNSEKKECAYKRIDGSRCPGDVDEIGEFCFWHDRNASKEGEDVKTRLQQWAQSGESMEGFQLRYARLEGIHLHNMPGYDMRNSNLFRAQLQGGHLFNLDLRGSDLLKADLSGANLNEAKLENADLLGANFSGTRMERTELGSVAVQHRLAVSAEKLGDRKDALKNYEEAEEVYRSLRQAHEGSGHKDEAGQFFLLEMTMRRKQMPVWSGGRIWAKSVDLFCAYGESPPRVIGSSLLFNLLCAVVYFLVGVNGPQGPIKFNLQAGFLDNAAGYFNCVYYSVVTFTTLGYGEITPPPGVLRPLAAVQAFTGAFMMAMFVAVFGQKMTR